jgi:hypothetical protein
LFSREEIQTVPPAPGPAREDSIAIHSIPTGHLREREGEGEREEEEEEEGILKE